MKRATIHWMAGENSCNFPYPCTHLFNLSSGCFRREVWRKRETPRRRDMWHKRGSENIYHDFTIFTSFPFARYI